MRKIIVIMMLMLVTIAFATDINVTGESELTVKPDSYQVVFGKEKRDNSVSALLSSLSTEIQTLINEMNRGGVNTTDNIALGSIAIEPAFKEEGGVKKPDGWSGKQMIIGKAKTLVEASDLLKLAFARGANLYYAIKPVLNDPSAAELKAYETAVINGKLKAQSAAKAAGFETVTLKSISNGCDGKSKCPPNKSPEDCKSIQPNGDNNAEENGILIIKQKVKMTFEAK